nr:hypothetical protein [Tanacetum cinerariifolium]
MTKSKDNDKGSRSKIVKHEGTSLQRNQANGNAGTKANIDVGQAKKNTVYGPQYVLLPLLTTVSQGPKSSADEVADDAGKKCTKVLRKENGVQDPAKQGRDRAQRIEFKSMIRRDKDASDNMIFTPMDVKSAFLYGTIKEEMYVCQPPSFEDPHFPNKDKDDILLVQVYVDDLIFGSTKKSLCIEFKGLMHKKFLISSTGELTFFLGLQVMQKDDGIFISQDKLMIRSLMYLTASRPDIMFAICACVRFQLTPKVSHLHDVKKIFRYLKGQPRLGLWYPMDSSFDLEAFLDSDCVRVSLDKKSTTGGCQFLRKRLISWQCKKQTVVANSITEAEYIAAANGKNIIVTEASIRRDLQLQDAKVFMNHQLGDMSHHKKIFVTPSLTKKIFANMKRERKGFSRIITPLFETMMKKQKSRRIQRKETEVPHTEPQTEESVPTTSNDPLPSGRMNEEKMFGVNDLDGDEVIVVVTASENVEQSTKVAEKEVSTPNPVTTAGEVVTNVEDVEVTTAATTLQIYKDEHTLAQTLIQIKAVKPKARWKDQIAFDEEVARKLKAEMKAKMEEKERIEREKDEANMALQTKEQEQLTDAEKARLFMELLEKRRKFFTRKKEIEKRNRPPIKAQQRNLIYINTEIVEDSLKKTQAEVTEGCSKRARDELEQESAKKHKLDEHVEAEVDNDQREAEIKMYMKIIPDDEIAIDAIPLETKPPIIVDWKIIKEGKISSYLLIRADASSKRYSSMIQML